MMIIDSSSYKCIVNGRYGMVHIGRLSPELDSVFISKA